MSNSSSNKILPKPILRKLRRLWSIPIVRITAAVITLILIISLIISAFKGCGTDKGETSDVSAESAADTFAEESISEVSEVSAEEVTALPVPWVYPEGTDDISGDISSNYGIIINATTRQVLGGKNHTQRIYPASMTKIMTLIVAARSNIDLNAAYTMDYRLVNKYYLEGASITGIQAGDTVTVKDLLYGAVLLSGADATAAIAEIVAGSEQAYVELMNKTAVEIGCVNSHFTNTSGLYDTENYSTLGDIALMLDYAMSIPLSAEILAEDEYTTPPTPKNPEGYKFTSTMFSRIRTDSVAGMTVAGGKTGYLSETRHCLASMAIGDNGEKFIVVTAGGQRPYDPINDCISLYSKYYGGTYENSGHGTEQ